MMDTSKDGQDSQPFQGVGLQELGIEDLTNVYRLATGGDVQRMRCGRLAVRKNHAKRVCRRKSFREQGKHSNGLERLQSHSTEPS